MTSVEYEIKDNNIDLSAIIDSQNNINLANMASNQTLFIANRDAIERVGIATVDAIERNTADIVAAVERNGSNLAVSVEKSRGDIISSISQSSGDIQTSIQKTANDIQLSQEQISSDTKQLLADNNTLNTTLNKDLQLELCKSTEKLTVQATENVGKVELCINGIKSHIELQIAQVLSSIQLESLNNIKVLSAQMLECCCNLKEMLATSTNATHQLIRELENTRVKDALANANMEMMMQKFKNS